VFGLVSERTGHPATARIEGVHGVARPPQDADGVVVGVHRLLVAVAVIGQRFARRLDGDVRDQSVGVEVLTDPVGVRADPLDRVAVQEVTVLVLEDDGIGGFDREDRPPVGDAGDEP
jgi:hypothetical protein